VVAPAERESDDAISAVVSRARCGFALQQWALSPRQVKPVVPHALQV